MSLFNTVKKKGFDKSSNPATGKANTITSPILAVVKDNIDPNKTGRIRGYLLDNSGADEDDSSNWKTLQYMSPFFGRTDPNGSDDTYGGFKLNPSSYGMWYSPPDIGSIVVCIFINGDISPENSFYIGSVPDPVALRMVPAIGANFEEENVAFNSGEATKLGGAIRVPVTNMNSNDTASADSPNFINADKPCHSYSAAVMFQQGILRDPIRGPISSSAQRESPSRVGWGVSTPGRPIYEGGYDDETLIAALKENSEQNLKIISRRGGHSIVMDDGDILGRDQLVRIRTTLGHQILMSDDGQVLMFLHANGQSYIELGKEGTVDVYSTNSVNIRTQGDLNLHADNNINIHAAKDLNIHAQNINTEAETNYNSYTGGDHQISTVGKHTIKAGGPLAMTASGEASMVSAAIAYVIGSKVNLNTGNPSTVPIQVPKIPVVQHTDTLFDKDKGYLAAPGKLPSITSRAPAHAPWAQAGQGADVETNLDAEANLPSAPSAEVSAANQAASTPAVPVDTGTINAIPNPTGAASAALDKGTTSAVLAVAATSTASTAQEAIKQGTAIVTDAAGQAKAVVGQFGQTAEEMENSGVLKPGAAQLVNSLVAGGATAAQAMSDNLFTGKPGASNLQQFTQNVGAQSASVVTNLQKAQSALTAAGAITGKETGSQIAGLVLSGVKEGVSKTLGALSSLTGGSGNTFLTGGAGLDALKTGPFAWISSGNFAAGLSGLTSGFGSIGQSVQAMVKSLGIGDIIAKTKGAVAGAFYAIAAAFKPFKANVPVNLKQVAQENAAAAEEAASAVADNSSGKSLLDTVKDGISAATGAATALASSAAESVGAALTSGGSLNIGAAAGAIGDSVGAGLSSTAASLLKDPTGSLTNPSGTVNTFVGGALDTASKTVSALSNPAASLASGVGLMPGGQGSIANIVDKTVGSAASLLPGVDKIKGLINDAQSAAMNGLPDPGSLLNQANQTLSAFASIGLPAGAASQLQAAISSVGNGVSSVKLPTVAVATNNRSSVTDATASVLDPGVPPPQYGNRSGIELLEALQDYDRKKAPIDNLYKEAQQAKKDYYKYEKEAWGPLKKEKEKLLKTSQPGSPERADWNARREVVAKELFRLKAVYDEKFDIWSTAFNEFTANNPIPR